MFFKIIFTWWNKQTFGTFLKTLFTGKYVGKDKFGNRYYKNKKNVVYINLKNLKCEDSSIILVIINMIRLSRPKKVKLVNMPNFLMKIIDSYKLEKILI